jgi:hypothetical protein
MMPTAAHRSVIEASRQRFTLRAACRTFAGSAVCDGGLVADLSAMKGIEIDPRNEPVWLIQLQTSFVQDLATSRRPP